MTSFVAMPWLARQLTNTTLQGSETELAYSEFWAMVPITAAPRAQMTMVKLVDRYSEHQQNVKEPHALGLMKLSLSDVRSEDMLQDGSREFGSARMREGEEAEVEAMQRALASALENTGDELGGYKSDRYNPLAYNSGKIDCWNGMFVTRYSSPRKP